ncbi:glycosyltransferase [Allokutzneria sp. A3M-2-11 16]|uniref:glycosyltransferase n=1 Tax=Allokutzneria sp. A3M-2-11 16 TaxID=2962043 RepID=UPI0020B6DCDF|nr:glycosyltransferase [Allokutzneria sp. A3M-2-11 16]MCP3805520.1 glycosyltransferase [Allokutzneria sp. A3M-2-11 16]
MDLVFTALPIPSHVLPVVVPVARAAARAGHRVRVATSASMTGLIEREGLEPLPLTSVVSLETLRTDPELGERLGLPKELTAPDRHTPAEVVTAAIARAFAGPIAGVFADELISLLDRDRPDLILRESNEFGGSYAARVLGVPQVLLDTAPMSAVDGPVILPSAREQHSRLGLPPVDRVTSDLRVGVVPEAWYPSELREPSARYYRLPPSESASLDLAELSPDRPVVLASLGTLAPSLPGVERLFDVIVEALGELPVHGVVALGGLSQRSAPDNVHLVSSVPQRALLTACDAFVSHSGFGAVQDSIATGVPMVAIPLFTDQHPNASRMAELGAAVVLDPETLSVDALISACRKVLDDPAHSRATRALTRAGLALPGVDVLLDDLAALVDRR